jgi:hypothetical protein
MVRTSFLFRFLVFSPAFCLGSVASVSVLTVVKTAVFFSHDFGSWLISWIEADVFPIALAELFRSPVMGLLFALLGTHWVERSSIIKFGFACGAFSYAVAYFFSVLGGTGGVVAQCVTSVNLIEYFLLGLPIALVLLSPLLVSRRV